jgi:hypothetical protein
VLAMVDAILAYLDWESVVILMVDTIRNVWCFAILACLSSPEHIRKVNTSSLGYLLHKHTFAFFLV